LECLDLFVSLKLKPSHHRLISDLILSDLKLTADEMRDLEIDISKLDMPKQEAIMGIMMGWKEEKFEQGCQKGLELGLEQGIERGLEQGRLRMAALVTRLLSQRLGALDECTVEQIRQLQAPQIEALSEALLDLANTSELVKWLQVRQSSGWMLVSSAPAIFFGDQRMCPNTGWNGRKGTSPGVP
jgi:flagellar biosynthesis/type III secretory pathway protein FliH